MRILIIEDNTAVADALRSMFLARKYSVDIASNGSSGLEALLRGAYDIAVVDVVLPELSGFDIVQRARNENVQIPVLMLTARDAVEDRVHGLNTGADDYLVKPFVEEELLARVNALLRRTEKRITTTIVAGELHIDPYSRTATYAQKPLQLGATEFRLLEFLARNVNIAFSRAQLLEHVWEYSFDGSPNIVDVYVSQLRKKLRAAGGRNIIATIWGVGYKLVA